MIERIQIRNFQRHRMLRVKFDERITTIVGPSDAGKSSVLRAIRWVAFNRPLGDGFVHQGGDVCSVKLWVDGHKVERRKAKGENAYFVDGKKLAAVGTEVPRDVQECLSLTLENFQGQHDPPFWFSLTAGEVAKRLNAIVDLEAIDRSAAWIAGRLRQAKAELSVSEGRLAEAEQECKELGYVERLAADFERLEEAWKRHQKSSESLSRLREAAGDALQAVQDRSRMRLASGQAWKLRQAADALETKLECLDGLRRSLEVIRESGANAEQAREAAAAAEAELAEKLDGVCPLCGGKMK